MVSLIQKQKYQDDWAPSITDARVKPWSHESLRIQTEEIRDKYKIESDRLHVSLLLDLLASEKRLSYEVLEDSDQRLNLVQAITKGLHLSLRATDIDALDNPYSPLYNRARFTVVHEIGHALRRHSIETNGLLPRARYESAECEANAFAAHLLMPVKAIKKANYQPDIICELCHVSLEAADHRVSLIKQKGW